MDNNGQQILELEWGTPGGEPVPSGMYPDSILRGFEPVPAKVDEDGKKYDAALKWVFEISQGEHKGKTATGIGPTKPTDKNATGRLLTSMGVAVGVPGARVNLQELIGKRFSVVIGPNKANRPVVQYAYPPKA